MVECLESRDDRGVELLVAVVVGWESLTPTEREVVRHAAEGLTNPEIGERMFISRGTVKVHLSHIYAKLDIRNRSELTAEVTRREASVSS